VCPNKPKDKQNKGKIYITGNKKNTNENVHNKTVPVLKSTPRHGRVEV
jgi:hypothetical protein